MKPNISYFSRFRSKPVWLGSLERRQTSWAPLNRRVIIWWCLRFLKLYYLTITHVRKKSKNPKSQSRKWPYQDHGHFLVHRDQFSSDSGVRGLDFRLRHCIRSFTRVFWVIRCQKTVSTKCVVTKDRARTLDSELSQGSLGTKITLKRSLEAVISTSLDRIGRGVTWRCS